MSRFNFGNTSRNTEQNNVRDFEPAVAFLNLGIPRADGSTAKVGKGIPLRASNKAEARVLALASTEEGLKTLLQNMVITIVAADGSDSAEFAI